MNKLEKANRYIQNNISKVCSRPEYHFTPPIGWMNDPNGLSYFNKQYHLFYQWGPYSVFWDNLHWGHAVSEDMVKWRHMPAVMAPDTMQDISGCFSGSAIEKDGELYLLYTGHTDPNLGFEPVESEIMQRQCLAKYTPEGNVVKCLRNPVLSEEDLPEGYLACDFRDPKVYKRGSDYYCVLAVRNADRRGSILLYRSADLMNWTFIGDIYRRDASDNTLFECPDLFSVDGKDVLLLSIMPCSREYAESVRHRVEYVVGVMDYEKNLFVEETRGLLDYGSNYYAPQTMLDKNGNRVVIGWICDWSKANEEYVKEYGYNGIMSLVRTINVESGMIVQRPVEEIKKYEQTCRVVKNFELDGQLQLLGDALNKHISLKLPELSSIMSITLLKSQTNEMVFTLDPVDNTVRLFSDYTIKVDKIVECDLGGELTLDIYIDRHCVELYVNGMAFTFLCYDKDKGSESYVASEGLVEVDELSIFKVCV